MIIEFPKKYSVRRMIDSWYSVLVPVDHQAQLEEVLSVQPWVSSTRHEVGNFVVMVNTSAYEITEDQAQAALERICEHVMTPTPEVDEDVWGEALEDGE